MESISPIVYHFTSTYQLQNILQENKFHASTTIGTPSDADVNKGKFFFFSTTRSRSLGYNGGNVKLVLNGDRLNQRYKGSAVDYWGYEWRKQGGKNEMEDRLFVDSPVIPNASRYIIEIHVYERTSKYKPEISKVDFDTIMNKCKQYNIPIYFYDDEKYFKNETKEKAIDPYQIYDYKEPIVYPEDDRIKELKALRTPIYETERIVALMCRNNPEMYNKIIKDLKLSEKHIESLDEEIEKLGSRWYYDYNLKDFTNVIESYIHNYKTNPNPNIRYVYKMLADDMKSNKISSLSEYIQFKLKDKIPPKDNY